MTCTEPSTRDPRRNSALVYPWQSRKVKTSTGALSTIYRVSGTFAAASAMVHGMRRISSRRHRRRHQLLVVLVLVTGWYVAGAALTPAIAEPGRAVAPLAGAVVRGFDPPDQPWLTGHRGVDLAGTPGQVVVAAMDGVVSFAGMVVDRPVISIRHGDLTTTYEPVEAQVSPGDDVVAGEPIGRLLAGHPCPAEACLHWGLRRGDTYLDPLSLLSGGEVRLIAAQDMETVRAHAAELARFGSGGAVSPAGLITPVTGVITSPYGMRIHPIEQVWRFHDGLDIGADCGSPIRAAAAGRVTESYYSSSYGNRLIIDHGVVNGHVLVTSYNHAQGYDVAVGSFVQQGQVIGWVGTTGDSTGCHLHFQTWVDGDLTDPQSVLP